MKFLKSVEKEKVTRCSKDYSVGHGLLCYFRMVVEPMLVELISGLKESQ